MSRIPRFRLLVLAAALVVAASPAPTRADDPGRPKLPVFLMLPGHPSLGQKDVRDELGLTTEQTRKLMDLGTAYLKGMQQAGAVEWAKLTPEERMKKVQELAAENARRTEQTGKDVLAVLTPEQQKKLDRIELRLFAGQLMFNPATADKLGLDDEQKEKARKAREQMQNRLADLQRQMQRAQGQASKAFFDLLTPEQQEKLGAMRREMMRRPGAPPGGLPGGLPGATPVKPPAGSADDRPGK